MNYEITDSTLTVANCQRIPGVHAAHGVVFSNANGVKGISLRSNSIEIELACHAETQTLEIPAGHEQQVERMMDDILVWTGDMSADDRDEKWGVSEDV